MSYSLTAYLSVLSVTFSLASTSDTRKECDADHAYCPTLLLQTSLDMSNQKPTRSPLPTRTTIEPESWLLPTRSPLQHADDVVGYATAPMNGHPVKCLEAACEYGVFLTEEMRRVGREKGYESQIALYNFWGLDQSLEKGDITVGKVQANHPIGDNTSFYTLQGAVVFDVIKTMLEEHGPPGQGGSVGSWLQVAGLRFQATWLPAEWAYTPEGIVRQVLRTYAGIGSEADIDQQRGTWTLRNIWVDLEDGKWAPLDPNYTYSVVSNQHVRFGMKSGLIPSNAETIDDVGFSIAKLVMSAFQTRSSMSPPIKDDRQLLAESLERLGNSDSPFYVDGCRDHACAYGTLACEEFRRVGRELGHATHIAFYSGALFHIRDRLINTSKEIQQVEAVANAAGLYFPEQRAAVWEDVTMEDMFMVQPAGHFLSFFWLTGATIRQMLQVMLADHGPPGQGANASWLQTAGLRFQATWDNIRTEWVLGPVEADLGNAAWQPVDNDLDYSVAADANLLGNPSFDFVAHNAVSQRLPGEGWGPAVVAVMAGIFRSRSPVSAPSVGDNVCLGGNCSWLPSSKLLKKKKKPDEEKVWDSTEDDWYWRILAAYNAFWGQKLDYLNVNTKVESKANDTLAKAGHTTKDILPESGCHAEAEKADYSQCQGWNYDSICEAPDRQESQEGCLKQSEQLSAWLGSVQCCEWVDDDADNA